MDACLHVCILIGFYLTHKAADSRILSEDITKLRYYAGSVYYNMKFSCSWGYLKTTISAM